MNVVNIFINALQLNSVYGELTAFCAKRARQNASKMKRALKTKKMKIRYGAIETGVKTRPMLFLQQPCQSWTDFNDCSTVTT